MSRSTIVLSVPFGAWHWEMDAVQLVGAAFIAFFTAVNCLAVREAAGVQKALTGLTIGAVALPCIVGFVLPAGR